MTRALLTKAMNPLGFIPYGNTAVSPEEAKKMQSRDRKKIFQGWSYMWVYKNEDTGLKVEFWFELPPGKMPPKDASKVGERDQAF